MLTDDDDRAEQPKPERSMRSMAAAASLPHHHTEPTWRRHGRWPPGTVAIRRDSPFANPEAAGRRASPFRRPAAATNTTAGSDDSLYFPEDMDNPKGKVEVITFLINNTLITKQ